MLPPLHEARDVRLAGCEPGEPGVGPLDPVLSRRGA
jgi:hypothetical protein